MGLSRFQILKPSVLTDTLLRSRGSQFGIKIDTNGISSNLDVQIPNSSTIFITDANISGYIPNLGNVVTQNTSQVITGFKIFESNNLNNIVLGVNVTTETLSRLRIRASGQLDWSEGIGSYTTILKRISNVTGLPANPEAIIADGIWVNQRMIIGNQSDPNVVFPFTSGTTTTITSSNANFLSIGGLIRIVDTANVVHVRAITNIVGNVITFNSITANAASFSSNVEQFSDVTNTIRRTDLFVGSPNTTAIHQKGNIVANSINLNSVRMLDSGSYKNALDFGSANNLRVGQDFGSITLPRPTSIGGAVTITGNNGITLQGNGSIVTNGGNIVFNTGTGNVQHRQTASTNPTVTAFGNTNTGMYFPSNNVFGFVNNGNISMLSTATGQIQFKQGTLADLSIGFQGGSTQNGIYQPIANTIAFVTNNVERFRIGALGDPIFPSLRNFATNALANSQADLLVNSLYTVTVGGFKQVFQK